MADIPKPTGLDWVKLRKDMDEASTKLNESPWERIIRKCKENPFVPGGNLNGFKCLTLCLTAWYSRYEQFVES